MDEQKDVQQVESSTTETNDVVTNTADTTPAETEAQSTTETTQSPPVVGQPQVEAVDEFGVPYKNRAFEWKRKNEELAEQLPKIVKDAVDQSLGQRQAEPQYTEEQLEEFASKTDNPYHAQWARGEIRKLQEGKTAKVIRGEIDRWKQEQQGEVVKRESYNYVRNTYPEVFLKDNSGNLSHQFNNNHPLTQIIGQFMQDPDLKRRPDGLTIASDLAYARYSRMVNPKIQQEQGKLKAEVKNLQKQTLVEGGKPASPTAPAHRVAIDRLKQSGSIKDATAAIKEIMKARLKSEEE